MKWMAILRRTGHMHNMLMTGASYDDVELGAGRRPPDGLFTFSKTAPELYNHIPGQTKPCPGAYFMADVNDTMKKIYVWRPFLMWIMYREA